MKIHILGICGIFMGSLALLARKLGHEVSGSDRNIYPPMSTQLQASGIPLFEDYSPENLKDPPELVIIGNTLSRGNPCVEYVLDEGLRYISGAQWLADNVLWGKHVLAVSGTHGKTTTTSMLAWLLERSGRAPGFLIGGVAENFGLSARLSESDLFVIEADEYDTAFFDKRSKFVHYRPRTLIINNIELDHVDIFADIAAIRREFHHLVRTLPGDGQIIVRDGDEQINEVLAMGSWTPVIRFCGAGGDWQIRKLSDDYRSFEVLNAGHKVGEVNWSIIGRHNAENALAAIAASSHVSVKPDDACNALCSFKSVKRRLERLANINGVTVYDDFAHHPTAIQATLQALRQHVGDERVIAVLEPRSNTMKMGIHKDELADALGLADESYFYQPGNLHWDLAKSMAGLGNQCHIYEDVETIINAVNAMQKPGDHIVIMSNGGFENIHQRLVERLQG